MSLLAPADQARLRDELAVMSRPVRLIFFTQTLDCETCPQTRRILDELPALSDKIAIEEVNIVLEADTARRYGVDRVPAIALVGQDDAGAERDSRIRFLGTPSGYEFISLIRAVRLVGGGPSQLSDASRTRLAAVDRPVSMLVFTTPTCPHCPGAVLLAHESAFASQNITAYAVEATEYPDMSRRYHVSGVPKTVVDGRVEILGAVPEDTFIDHVLSAVSPAVPHDGADGAEQAR